MTTRNSKGQFVKGQSGNPAGKSKRSIIVDYDGNAIDLNSLYLANAGIVLVTLLEIIVNKNTSDATKVTAIKEWNNRALGRSPETRQLDEPIGDSGLIDVSMLPPELLAQLAAITQPANLIEDKKGEAGDK